MTRAIGKIEITVSDDGKAPMTVTGLDDFKTIAVLSSVLLYANAKMAEKPLPLSDKIKHELYTGLLKIFGGDDGFPIINAMAWCINRVSLRMARDKGKESIIVSPDFAGWA